MSPFEMASQLAQAAFRIGDLENRLAGLTRVSTQRTADLEAYAKSLLDHARALDARVKELHDQNENQRNELAHVTAALQHHRDELIRAQQVIAGIHGSRGWKWLCRYHRARNTVWGGAARLFRRLARRPLPGPVAVSADPPAPVGQEGEGRFGAGPSGHPPAAEAVPQAAPVAVATPDRPQARGEYGAWVKNHEPGPAELERQRGCRFVEEPKISLLVPAAGNSPGHLQALVRSVLRQTYPGWELWVIGGMDREAGGAGHLPTDPRVQWLQPQPGEGPAETARKMRAAATGEYVGLLGPNDLLAPFALYEVVRAINDNPGADFLYSDEDVVDEDARERCDPHFKPDWSPDTLRSHNYVGQLFVLSRALLDKAGGFREGVEAARNYDLLLRAGERAGGVVHIPKVLYHRRRLNATADVSDAEAARAALRAHLGRLGLSGQVLDGPRPGTFQVRYALPASPLVSILIPNRDNAEMLRQCVASIRRSSHPRYEILVLENGSRQPETFACYQELARQPGFRVHTWDRPFNYAALNNEGVRRSGGEVLLFLNNDTRVINPDWLERLLEHALLPHVGAVGAKLYYLDDTVQHAGVLVARCHGPAHYFVLVPRDAAGHGNRLVVAQNLSAVTGACLMTRRAVFEEAGGLDEGFAVAYNDIDYCFQVRRRGYLVVWTPHAELYHIESFTRGYKIAPGNQAGEQAERDRFCAKWAGFLNDVDPYYSPNLAADRPDGALAA